MTQYSEIKNLDFDFLNKKLMSEEILKNIAQQIPNNNYESKIIYSLLEKIPYYGRNYDWNIGSILQHMLPATVFKEFKKFDSKRFLNSIGLTWVFWEYEIRDEFILQYLYEVLNCPTNEGAWRKSGFSIDRIKKNDKGIGK
jgi:hypothetical protein